MSLSKTRGIILNSRPLGEWDRIVEVFSEDMGRIQGVAKGARSFKNRFGGSLEPFTYCRLNLFKKRNGTLYRIESADIIESFHKIRDDLSLLLHASCVIDALRKLVPFEEPNKTISSLLYESLQRIVSGDPADKILFYYQIRLLQISGVGPRLEGCLKCNREIKGAKVIISILDGGPVCPFCSVKTGGRHIVVTGGTIAVIRRWQCISLYHVNRFILTDGVKEEIKEMLDKYISYVTGKKLLNMEGYLS